MKTYQIYFIRHAVTTGNLEGKYIGRTDLPLAPEGRQQLLELKEKYEYPRAEAYFTSPLKRCTETLEILYPDATPIPIPGFRECNFGRFEERTAEELADDPDFLRWMNEGGDFAPPEGESSNQFVARTLTDFEKVVNGMIKTGTQNAVVVAHSGTIMAILAAYGLPKASFYDWATASGHGYCVRIQPQLWTSGKVFEVYDVLPFGQSEKDEDISLVEMGREAASRAYSDTGYSED